MVRRIPICQFHSLLQISLEYLKTHDESIQLSITSTYLSGYSKRDRFIRAEKVNEWVCTITRQQFVIGSQKNMSQQQLEDPCNLSADVYSALEALSP